MMIERREFLVVSGSLTAVALTGVPVFAQDPAPTIEEVLAEFSGGAEIVDGEGVTLDAPEIAENGNTVPISVSADGATEILVLASGNPVPEVAVFKFGELAGQHAASTRIRLAKTQDLLAIAKLADGSLVRTSKNVKVTIGGCGG